MIQVFEINYKISQKYYDFKNGGTFDSNTLSASIVICKIANIPWKALPK